MRFEKASLWITVITFWLALKPNSATKEFQAKNNNSANNNTSTYLESNILMNAEKSLAAQRSNIRRAIKPEFEKLQNEIQALKAGQEKIQSLLVELKNEILHSSTSTSSASPSSSSLSSLSGTNKRFDDDPQIYDAHFNCLKNCTIKKNRTENCADAMPQNQYKFGIYLLNVPQSGLSPFYAYCRMHEDKHWTIIQRRIDGSVNFYRNWHEYKHGFGDLYGEYWLGLARLHAMTAQRNYELWILLSDFNHKQKSIYYGKFAVASEEEGFALTVHNYVGDIEDSLKYTNGRKFSTYDHYEYENVFNRINCAQTYKSAWWYYDCFSCSLNGEYFSHSNRRTRYGIFWRDWHSYESLRSAHMAIRPV